MNKKIILTLVLVINSVYLYSQRDTDLNIEFSTYTSLDASAGFEIRKIFPDWYISFQGEKFRKETTDFLNWGGVIGVRKPIYKVDLLAGIRAGFIEVDYNSKPSFGLEAEANYRFSRVFFGGIRFAHDTYTEAEFQGPPVKRTLNRFFVKVGLKF